MSHDVSNTVALINLCHQVIDEEHYTFDRLLEITDLNTSRLRKLLNFTTPDDYRLAEDTDG